MNTPQARALATAEHQARDLLARLPGSTRRDRAAFTLGYVLALDDLAEEIDPARLARHLIRAQALHQLADREPT